MANSEGLLAHVEYILNHCHNPREGLPEEVFLMISALIPVANIDLFIFNKKNELLLSWRDDIYFGQGWSIPGGCIRFGELLEERVHKTAIKELGQDVKICNGPITVRDVIRGENHFLPYPNIRGHNITIPYICNMTDEKKFFDNVLRRNHNLRWFSEIPKDILSVHHVYDDIFKSFGLMKG